MKASKVQRFQEKLSEMRSDLRDRIGRATDVIHDETDPPGEHEIAASEGVDSEVTRVATASEMLEQVKLALARIDEGSYGHCQVCGGEISLARLNAVPYAACCSACEQKM